MIESLSLLHLMAESGHFWTFNYFQIKTTHAGDIESAILTLKAI